MSVAPAGTFTDVTGPPAEQLLVTVPGLVGGFVVGGAVGGAVGATVGGTVVLTGLAVVGVGALVPGTVAPGTVVDPGFNVVPTPAGTAVVATGVPVVAAVDEVTESPVTSVAVGAASVDPLADSVVPSVVLAVALTAVPSSCEASPPSEPPHDETAKADMSITAAQRRTNELDGFTVWLQSR